MILLAVVVAASSLLLGVIFLFADDMSDVPGETSGGVSIAIGGLILAALIAGFHFLPHAG